MEYYKSAVLGSLMSCSSAAVSKMELHRRPIVKSAETIDFPRDLFLELFMKKRKSSNVVSSSPLSKSNGDRLHSGFVI